MFLILNILPGKGQEGRGRGSAGLGTGRREGWETQLQGGAGEAAGWVMWTRDMQAINSLGSAGSGVTMGQREKKYR